jgi:glycosyltransferase involved in cell wall biosynthesis
VTTEKQLVSIVMPSFNQGYFIEKSIASVLCQSYRNIELIVADGGSKDNTLSLLKSIQKKDNRLRWFSSSDTGPANALNKAFSLVRGTAVGWLNSDDLYSENAIQCAVEKLFSCKKYLMVYGHGKNIDAKGKVLNLYPTLGPDSVNETFMQGCFICQPTVFFKTVMVNMLGPLDESLKTAFDFDYWLRAFKSLKKRIAFIDRVQAYSRLHDECITLTQRNLVTVEGMILLKRHLGVVPLHWFESYINECLSIASGFKDREKAYIHLIDTLGLVSTILNKEEKYFLESEIQLKFEQS